MAVVAWELAPAGACGAPRRVSRPTAPAPLARPSRAVYRRRRLAVLAAAVTTVSSLATVAGATGATAGRALPPPPPPARVVVEPGDTVWDLAAARLPAGEDLRGYVAEVVERNRVDATALPPGSVLLLPRR